MLFYGCGNKENSPGFYLCFSFMIVHPFNALGATEGMKALWIIFLQTCRPISPQHCHNRSSIVIIDSRHWPLLLIQVWETLAMSRTRIFCTEKSFVPLFSCIRLKMHGNKWACHSSRKMGFWS